MRSVFAIAPIFVVSAAIGAPQAWQAFGVRQGGFIFDVPPEFALQESAETGMGGSFRSEAGASLKVWGDTLLADKFEATILAQLNKDEADGWKVTYRRITPRWASYSGIKDGEIRYFRAIAICDNRFAVFQLDYSQEDKVAYDPIVERMVDSLKVEGC